MRSAARPCVPWGRGGMVPPMNGRVRRVFASLRERARSALAGAAAVPCAVLPALLPAQGPAAPVASTPFAITAVSCPRVVDPKLTDARIELGVELRPARGHARVTMTLLQHGTALGTIWSGRVAAAAGRPHTFAWNGRLAQSPLAEPRWIDPGAYEVRFDAVQDGTALQASTTRPLHVVRLGITEIAALPAGPQTEWQMVWFRRGTMPGTFFHAAPALREYLNVAGTGELADLDRNDGSPRPSVPVHVGTASPAMEGTSYEDDAHNYPVCYLGGVAPRFEVRFGATAIGANGLPLGAKYPIPGVLLRCRADSTIGAWTSTNVSIAPGQSFVFVGPTLPAGFDRRDVRVEWSFDSTTDGGLSWARIPGRIATTHRIYTVPGVPRFGSSFGPQHNGPWVEVADYAYTWKHALGIETSTPAGLTEVVVKGFGGQIGPLANAIEGVRYDTSVLGGDGGASHYYDGAHAVALSRLLDNHANGVFVNCSDCAAATSAMLAMLGVQQVQMQRLGAMTLRAIRGIGAPGYTLSLWGPGFQHSFSYHHVVTRTAGTTVCDACLWVDEDGNPNALPGAPGYNVDRPWSGSATSYQSLLAWNALGSSLEPLPVLQ
jgi:hypothetical protein